MLFKKSGNVVSERKISDRWPEAAGGLRRSRSRRRRWGGSARPVVSASGQLPLSNPSGHLEDGMMRQRSED